MRVFISWSGETSKPIAEFLRQWLPSVLQAVKPYFSPDDIAKGTRWSTEIGVQLSDSRIGLIILTKDNLQAPWVMFEAGALSKNIGSAKVIPILFGVEPAELVGPMTQFQAARFSKDDIRRVVTTLNTELGDNKLEPDVLDDVFEMWWPRLNEAISAILKAAPVAPPEAARSEKDILAEVLALTRTLSRPKGSHDFSPMAVDDLVEATLGILTLLTTYPFPVSQELREAVARLEGPLVHLARRGSRPARSTGAPVPARDEVIAAFTKFRVAVEDELPF